MTTTIATGASLDPSQEAAARIAQGPLLLGAGPGTGKTKTLVARCQYLIREQGVRPPQILALTFSRDAAAEMRVRLLQAEVGDEKNGPWVGTFHGFGLEILSRYGSAIGLPPEIAPLSSLDCLTLLENHLPRLELRVLDNLYNPATHLRGILRQISRAKDELCSPERYAQLCRQMQSEAERAAAEFEARPGKKLKKDQEALTRQSANAAKALEVAHCYTVYEGLMAEYQYVDFADLIAKSVALLESHPQIQVELQRHYPHVLADEYQDVNRGCARLVRLLAGEQAAGLWAVGDHRQSIYRFRGASPANVAAFQQDYPNGTRLELGVNYRSCPPIVACFSATAVSENFTGWQAARSFGSPNYLAVTLAAAPDEEGQADGIAQAIRTLLGEGWAYRDQAILCRTHAQAERLVALLTAREIPLLYLGALLERPEIKDLLCLLSLLTGTQGTGLLRVAALPEYAVPQSEIWAFLSRRSGSETPLREALSSPEIALAQPGFQKLAQHLAALEAFTDDPALCLHHYLEECSGFLGSLETLQARLAIEQLLEIAQNFAKRIVAPASSSSSTRIQEFLTHLQRMIVFGEGLRGEIPDGPNAVRLITAHKAKGLEYPIVFVPNLAQDQFPSRGRHDGIPEPPGLTVIEQTSDETDEDDCLFFVALSRARDHLILSRATASPSGKPLAPSPLLTRLQSWLETNPAAQVEWPSGRTSGLEEEMSDEALSVPTGELPLYTATALELYLRCPRQYYYERERHLPGMASEGSGYPQFHACLRQALRWIDDERAAGWEPAQDALMAKLDELWAAQGPLGHLHEAKYRESAVQMLLLALAQTVNGTSRLEHATLTATLANCRVTVWPDTAQVNTTDGSLLFARHLTGKPGDSDHTDKRLALIRRAAAETHPGRAHQLELRYLATGETIPIEPPATEYKAKLEADRLRKYERAAQGISLRVFSATPESSDLCQTCPYTLVCPA